MLILDTLVDCVDGRLTFPFYHRGHLSLKSNTSLTLCLIPPEPEGPPAAMPELIASPVAFESWRHLWRINAVFHEQQGVVHKILKILGEVGLNILVEESSSVQNRHYHPIEILADAAGISGGSQTEGVDEVELLQARERRITAICINELVFRADKPRIKVRRMKGLYNAWRAHADARDDSGS